MASERLALTEDISLVPNTHVRQLTTACNSSSRRIQCLWPLWLSVGMCTCDLGSANQTHPPECWKSSDSQHGDFVRKWMAAHFISEATLPGHIFCAQALSLALGLPSSLLYLLRSYCTNSPLIGQMKILRLMTLNHLCKVTELDFGPEVISK